MLKNDKGISLIETIIGLAILGAVGVLFLSGLGISYKGEKIHKEQATGQVIASRAIEYVKSQPFSETSWSYTITSSNRSSDQPPSWWEEDNPPLLDEEYYLYSLNISAEDFDKDNDGTIEVPGDDDSIKKITAHVYNNSGKMLFSLEDYKAIQ